MPLRLLACRARPSVAAVIAEDTVLAPATAPGRAAIGILRVSGPQSAALCLAVTGRPPPPPRRASLRRLRDPRTGDAIDEGLVVWFPAPGSYTGEDMLELQHHGSPAVARTLIEACLSLPWIRPALPGELTRRAFLAGRMDLTQAEAIADLVEATTRAQARQAMRQLDGELGRLCERWRGRLLDGLAQAEAEIDFGADGDGVPSGLIDGLRELAASVASEIGHVLATARCGERLREGFVVAVIGEPNVGKSSLVNAIARRDVAIVTPMPGTTRDVIEVAIDLDGLPVTLLDTAGLRETSDPVEAEGVARARRRAAEADLRLMIVDRDDAAGVMADADTVVVRSKVDLAPSSGSNLAVSSVTGEGLDRLLEMIAGRLRRAGAEGAAVVTRERHRLALAEAVETLRHFLDGMGHIEPDLLAEDVRLAAAAVGKVTGRVGIEEILDRIFSRFCIGK